MGGERIYVDNVYVNNKAVKLKLAYDVRNPSINFISRGQRDFIFGIDPGETIVFWALTDEPMKAGVTYSIRIHTTLGHEQATLLKPSLGIDLASLAMVRLIAIYYDNIHGNMVEFDPATWEYRYWYILADASDPDNATKYTVIGRGGIRGNITHLPPPVYYGDTPLTINAYEDSADFNIPPTAPIIMVLNLYAHLHTWNFTWKDLSTYTDKFILEKVPKAVTGLDFILLWEDQWSNPNVEYSNHKEGAEWQNGPDPHSWIDHVVRVTWLEDGRIRIGVYRAGGGYLHVFYIGEDYIYEKPHHDYWGDPQFIHNVDPNNPGYGTYWWWENGMKIHVEIGHNLQDGSDSGIWISDNNYNVTIWYRG